MNGSGTPINTPGMLLEHLKADVRGTTWCGLRYTVSDKAPRSGKPECSACRAIENGEEATAVLPPLFGSIR